MSIMKSYTNYPRTTAGLIILLLIFIGLLLPTTSPVVSKTTVAYDDVGEARRAYITCINTPHASASVKPRWVYDGGYVYTVTCTTRRGDTQ